MKPAARKRNPRIAGLRPALSILMCIAFLAGCGNDEEQPNQPPTVELTAGPVEGETVSYSVEMAWSGSDVDGLVDRYEYAVDPPPAFTETEIAEGGPDIVAEFIPGDDENPAVTRISKTEGLETYSFDWVHTLDSSRLFAFSATQADSADEDTTRVPTGRFHDMHGFYVRAIDDDEAASPPAKVAFTAETIAPTAEITRPTPDGILILGPAVTFAWEGTDPDSPGGKPKGYLYRVVRLDTLDPPISIFSVVDALQILFDAQDPPWTFRDADSPAVTLQLNVPADYVIGVRAVDEAGAEEPFLEWDRNAVKFQAYEIVHPVLTVVERGVGSFIFRGFLLPPEQVEIGVGAGLEFTWSASAEEYGGEIWGYSWGVDIADLDPESNVGWSSWSQRLSTPEPIVFSKPGVHTFHVRARDLAQATTTGTIVLRVIDFPMESDALYVDDSFDDLYPRDHEHDGFWRSRFEGDAGITDFGEFHAHLDNDRGALSPLVPTVDDLSHYRLVVWENKGSGYNATSALLGATAMKAILGAYLRGGGQLWLGGRMTTAATVLDATGLRADLVYPKELSPGGFAWDFLKLHSAEINNDKGAGTSGVNNLIGVKPYPGKPVVYEAMQVDVSKLNPALQDRGVSHADAVFDPILAHGSSFRGIIDSLYVYCANGPENLGRSSQYQDRLVALRWHDPDPDPAHGRVQWFGFPLYFFFDDQAQDTFNKSLDWFREEPAP